MDENREDDTLLPLFDGTVYGKAINKIGTYTATLHDVAGTLSASTNKGLPSGMVSAMGAMQEQFHALSTFQSALPKIDVSIHSSPTLQLMRDATVAMSNFGATADVVHLMKTGGVNLKPLYDQTINTFGLATAVSPLSNIDISKGYIVPKIESFSALGIQANVIKATEFSVFAEKSIAAFPMAEVGRMISLAPNFQESINASFLGLSQTYTGLVKSFETNPASYIQIHPSIAKSIPIEYYSTANLLEVITVDHEKTDEEEKLKKEITYENEVTLSEYLPQLNPGYFKMWKGAIEAYHSNNIDKVRHFAVSIRELITHVLHNLAPTTEITEWSTDPTLYDSGKPTRRARLLYINRNIENDLLSKFVKKDIEATLAFIDIFQQGTHDVDPNFTDQQLVAIKSKAESSLKFLLEIEFKTNR